jgi:T-complex protein 1 subunit gamma
VWPQDIMNEVERNLTDAMGVARNVCLDPRLVPGGGAMEMAVSKRLADRADQVMGTEQWAYRAVASTLEVIPRTLARNCGANVIRTITKLRAKHAEEADCMYSIDGNTGKLTDMKELGVWEPYQVKVQTCKTAIESATLLLRINDIVSGLSKKSAPQSNKGPAIEGDGSNVDSEQQLAE